MKDAGSGAASRTRGGTKRAHLSVAVGLTVGLTLTAAAFLGVLQHDERTMRAEFERLAADRIHAVAKTIELQISTLHAVRAFMDATGEVERTRFHDFVTPLISECCEIQALEWVLRVGASEREAYEGPGVLDGFRGFEISESAADGSMIRAGDREEYFPVFFVEPYTGNERSLGFDIASDPKRRRALEAARDSGEPAATSRVKLVQETEEQYSALVLVPRYRPGATVETVEQRRTHLVGFVLGAMRLVDVLRGAVDEFDPVGIDIALVDLSEDADVELLAFQPSRTRTGKIPSYDDVFSEDSRPRHGSSLEIAGRRWMIESAPTPGFRRAHRSSARGVTLVTGSVITALLTAWLWLLQGRRSTEEALQISEERTRRILANSLDAAITMDANGIITGWEAQAEKTFGWSHSEAIGRVLATLIVPRQFRKSHNRGLKRFLATGKGPWINRLVEVTALHREGHEFPAELAIAPISFGDSYQFSAFIRDISGRKQAEAALRDGERRYRTLVENAPEAIVVFDLDEGCFVDVNRNAERLFKLSREELFRMGPADVSPPLQPDGTPSSVTVQSALARAVEGETPLFEWTHCDAEGNELPCEIRLVKLPSAGSRLIRGSITDISERKRAEQRQQFLMRELDHRVKNNLATVLALAEQTAATADSVGRFHESFTGRIRALARTHEALAEANWEGVRLDEIVRLNLEAFVRSGERRVGLDGERVLLSARAGSSLCMAFHELTSNATKYGALSSPQGRVMVTWKSLRTGGVDIRWSEAGGPTVNRPTRQGFGTTLIQGVIEYELDGTVELDFRPEGLQCRIEVPTSEIRRIVEEGVRP